jgi:anti-anti-sigma regulatory factor
LGELVRTLTTIRARGGQLKLAAVNLRLARLLEVTRLNTVFELAPDEATALAAFGSKGAVA